MVLGKFDRQLQRSICTEIGQNTRMFIHVVGSHLARQRFRRRPFRHTLRSADGKCFGDIFDFLTQVFVSNPLELFYVD